MAEKKTPLPYLETVEAPRNESKEPCKTGNAPINYRKTPNDARDWLNIINASDESGSFLWGRFDAYGATIRETASGVTPG